jgi:Rrf2 family iron-sulfur cluster assembly transcriptional regulator
MKLTTKGRFAVTALLDIAIYSKNAPVSLQHISERQSISLSYLEQLFVKLRQHGMVKSFKGPGGGYILDKKLEELCVSSIIKAVDDDMDARNCAGQRNCHNNKQCLTHNLWENLTNHIYSYLDKITLKDLIKPNLEQNTINIKNIENKFHKSESTREK